MTHFWIRNTDGEVYRIDDIHTWARWIESKEHRFIKQSFLGPSKVSTVFLGMDYDFDTDPYRRPMLFETMIFGGQLDEETWRYCTEQEAIKGHRRAMRLVAACERWDVLHNIT